MVMVKICGICNEKDVKLCSRANANALGFVTEYPERVPWNLRREEARKLVDKVPPFLSSVVVTSGDIENLLGLAKHVRPDIVQLHGEESPEMVEKTVKRLDRLGIRTIKALQISESEKIEEILSKALAFQETGIDALTLDAKRKGKAAGGTGMKVDWSKAKKVSEALSVPIILAGGLNSTNVKKAVKYVKPFAVDVITGVEKSPGVKDPDKVEEFIKAAGGKFE